MMLLVRRSRPFFSVDTVLPLEEFRDLNILEDVLEERRLKIYYFSYSLQNLLSASDFNWRIEV